MRPGLSMRMQMRTSPQLVLAGELLRLSSADLENLVLKELEENPALEQVNQASSTPGISSRNRKLQASHHSRWELHPDDSQPEFPAFEDSLEKLAVHEPVLNQLVSQAALLVTRKDLVTLTAIIYALDENGYLKTSPEHLSAHLDLDVADVKRLIPVLYQLEPPGVGARDLRECLSIQCDYLEAKGVNCSLVKQVLDKVWDDFVAQRWERAAKKLGISSTELESVLHFIAHNLYPHPLAMAKDDPETWLALDHPDLIISRSKQDADTGFTLHIPAAEAFELRMSTCFTSVLEASWAEKDLSQPERNWLQTHMERARLFILSLQKRWDTLRRVGEYVIQFQKDFLELGPSRLKPLTQTQVARALACHESTVSRAVSNKIVQLPNGRLVPMDIFFDAAIPIKAALQQILSENRKPMSDREMTERLSLAGYSVARRTVTKYRAQIGLTNRSQNSVF